MGTVYRSEHSKWFRAQGIWLDPPLAPTNEAGYPIAAAPGSRLFWRPARGGARPQLWKVLWTKSTLQGRRPT